jgi:hypothetical protein
MWPFSSSCDHEDGCLAIDPDATTLSSLFTLVPFAGIFLFVNTIAVRHLFPRLNTAAERQDGEDHYLPPHAPPALRQAHAEHGSKSWARRGVAWTFGTTVGLAATLGALILAEILDVVEPRTTALALRMTVSTLLVLLVLVVPWLECRSIVSSMGWSLQRTARGKVPKVAYILHSLLFKGWLFVFWSVGSVVPEVPVRTTPQQDENWAWLDTVTRSTLERIGVIGISLMALLAGFAAVSSPWHTFSEVSSRRKRPVTDSDVSRKETGLEATNEMLLTKRHQLQVLERRAVEQAQQPGGRGGGGFMSKMIGSIRGASGDEAEMCTLRMEISGLETMEANLLSNLSSLRGRRAADERAATAAGRLLLVPSYMFSCYCLYRVIATLLTTLRRAYSPSASFASSDPINRFLGLIAKHWDPSLDQLAWARTISFALSGVILLASANSVVQTFHLFAKWCPGLLRHAHANLALAVGQVAATYVISASLLMRSQLPAEVRTAVGRGVLRSSLSPSFVDSWFEGWFLLGSALTAMGICLGRTLSGPRWGDDELDEYAMEEMGAKRM